MSVSTEITRIQNARNTLRTKAVALGIASGTDKLDDLADAYDAIVNQGAVTATIQEGDSYTIPQGYHNGSGTVSAVAGGGNYSLQAKGPITPTTSQQSITADVGYYGLSAVTISAIPNNYKDVSSTTATAAHVLANDVFIAADGTTTAGTMTNNGAVTHVLDCTLNNQTYTIPAGYHNGSGHVDIVTESKTVTPTESLQTITPTAGKTLGSVVVNAIPAKYGDTTGDDAIAANLLYGKFAHSISAGSAVQIEGTMANNGAISGSIDGLSVTSYSVPSGYTSGGTVSLTNDIETALAAI